VGGGRPCTVAVIKGGRTGDICAERRVFIYFLKTAHLLLVP
jgi:hypothetical protein